MRKRINELFLQLILEEVWVKLRFASHNRKIFMLRFNSQFFAIKISLSLRFAILFCEIFGALVWLYSKRTERGLHFHYLCQYVLGTFFLIFGTWRTKNRRFCTNLEFWPRNRGRGEKLLMQDWRVASGDLKTGLKSCWTAMSGGARELRRWSKSPNFENFPELTGYF